MWSYIATLLLFSTGIVFHLVSAPSWGSNVAGIIFLLLLGATFLSLSLLPWLQGDLKSKIVRSCRFGFPLSALVFLAGYVFEIVNSIL